MNFGRDLVVLVFVLGVVLLQRVHHDLEYLACLSGHVQVFLQIRHGLSLLELLGIVQILSDRLPESADLFLVISDIFVRWTLAACEFPETFFQFFLDDLNV
jgi:hypothetical protein